MSNVMGLLRTATAEAENMMLSRCEPELKYSGTGIYQLVWFSSGFVNALCVAQMSSQTTLA